MPSYTKSMTSQLVLMIAIAITLMQLYKFYISGEILDLFNTLSSMVLWAYFRWQIWSQDNKTEQKENEKKSLHDINDIQDVG